MMYTSNTFVPNNYEPREADVVFLGVPFGATSVSKPSIYGPVMVRESLKIVEDFVPAMYEKIKVCDLGDLEFVPGSFELTAERVRETARDIMAVNKKAFIILVGGEHSMTLPLAEVLEPKTIVHFDAHGDCLPDYLGNKYTHQTWAWHASRFSRIIQLGVNTKTSGEERIVKERNIERFGFAEFIKKTPKMQKPVHVSIDIDVFDPSFIGETGYYEGKATKEEVFGALGKIGADSLDIMEICDDKLPSKSGFLAADIIQRVLAKRFL